MKKQPYLAFSLCLLLYLSACLPLQSETISSGGLEFVGNPEGVCVQIGDDYLLELEECDARLLFDDKGKRVFLIPEGMHKVLFFRDGVKVGEQIIEIKKAIVTTVELP